MEKLYDGKNMTGQRSVFGTMNVCQYALSVKLKWSICSKYFVSLSITNQKMITGTTIKAAQIRCISLDNGKSMSRYPVFYFQQTFQFNKQCLVNANVCLPVHHTTESSDNCFTYVRN